MSLPGGDLIRRGIDDRARGLDSIEALLVSIGAPRLTRFGFEVPDPIPEPERQLQPSARGGRRLCACPLQRAGPAAGELRARGRMRQVADADRIRRFMQAFGSAAKVATR